jgi:hypothetical protein
MLFFASLFTANEKYNNLFNTYIPISFIPIALFFINNSNDFSIEAITKTLYIHRPYLGFMLCTCVLMIGLKLVNMKSWLNKKTIIYSTLILLLLGFCLIIHAKMALIALFISVFSTFFCFLKRKSKIYFLLFTMISVVGLSLYVSIVKEQEMKELKSLLFGGIHTNLDKNNILSGDENSFNLRKITWRHSVKEIKENVWLGVGSFNAQKSLDNYYSNLGYPWMIDQNTHNQYLNHLLVLGVLGFFSVFLFTFYPLYISILNKSPFLFSFNLLFILCCLTENMLSRQWGLVVYVFINSYLIFNIKLQDDKKIT